jgi:hypothetical protein
LQPVIRICAKVSALSLCSFRGLDDFVENVAVLIDGAPEAALLAIDCDDDFIEAPNVPPAWRLAL